MQAELAAHILMRKCVADESRGEPTLYLGKVQWVILYMEVMPKMQQNILLISDKLYLKICVDFRGDFDVTLRRSNHEENEGE